MISNSVATSKALHLLVCAMSDEDHKLLNTVLLCTSYGTHDVKTQCPMTSTATLLHICMRNCSFESAGGVETDIISYCVHSLPHLLVTIQLRKPVCMPQFSFLLYGPPFFSNSSYKMQVFAPSLCFQCYNLVSVRVPHVFYFLTLRK